MRILPLFLLAALFLSCASRNNPPAAAAGSSTFKNPIAKGADPWVIRDGNQYYVCLATGGGNGRRPGITVSKSASLTEPGKRVTVWQAPESGWNRDCIWAPELHRIGNRWYIYYAAGKSGPPYINQRSGVLESVTDDPQGAYTDKGILRTGIDERDYVKTIWAIDLTVANIKGKLYAVWSGWERNAATDKTSQRLYIASMTNPWTISSPRVEISRPEEEWETGGTLDLNEGPQFLQRKGKTFIIYSTRESWTKDYRLGQLMLKNENLSPLNKSNWIKKGPVFRGTAQVPGPGHASFTTSPDGKEWWIFYHAKLDERHNWNRDLRLQPFTWDKSGQPVFGQPVPAGQPLARPSGEK
ncbi:glycoside hydrolase [Pedobacter yulinensis]|uniref:Glycoside hydrolase n=1 Tax=Pedobacter yulinensis TaxID=2126353 RepID=A0A2T3HKD9_9SPHI|nr:glycoside hydrolase family 43 protein [Pedobacter yulinensis]PST82873.1 glycoside hydrolase [Pedobacter yulinensis]